MSKLSGTQIGPGEKCECKRVENRLDLKLFVIYLVIINLISLSHGSPSEPMAKALRKCCPLGQYFNVERGVCESQGTSWSTGLNGTLTFSEDKKTLSWTPPPKFWEYFADKQPILTFDSKTVGSPHCTTGKEQDVRTVAVEIPQTKWDENSSWDWEHEINFFFRPNQSMLIEVTPTSPYKETYHNPEQFCIDFTETELVLRICVCSAKQPCIHKCCHLGDHLKLNSDQGGSNRTTCVRDERDSDVEARDGLWEIPLHSKPGVPLSSKEREKLLPRTVLSDKLNCHTQLISTGWSVSDIFHAAFVVHQSGSPQFYNIMTKTWNFIPEYSDFCFDRLEASAADQVCPGEPEVLLICLNDTISQPPDGNATSRDRKAGTMVTKRKDAWQVVYFVGLVIATIVLFITAVVLACLLEKKNIHSWTRLAYVLCNFTFFFLLVLAYAEAVAPHGSNAAKNNLCKFVAVLIHFTGLTTACWLSIINFDLWWTFRVLKPRSGDKLDVWRFIWYTCFSLGLPLMIILIGLVIQDQEPKFPCRKHIHSYNPISPKYGERSCSMSADARPAYWFGPLLILLFANLVFFCTTTCRMVNLQRMTRRASIESTHGQTQSRKIFIKIFIVSGVTWWVEIIQWFFKNDSKVWYWKPVDMIHFVQACALFVIFVCKTDVIRSLQIKFPLLTKVIPPVSRFQPSGTALASMSTDPSSRIRIVQMLTGRKMSTVSMTSSNNVPAAAGTITPTERYKQRQESIELPATNHASSGQEPSSSSSSSAKTPQRQDPPPAQFVERRDTTESELESEFETERLHESTLAPVDL